MIQHEIDKGPYVKFVPTYNNTLPLLSVTIRLQNRERSFDHAQRFIFL